MAEIRTKTLLAVPYDIERGGQEKNTTLLDHMVEHPLWFNAAMSPDEIRITAAWMLTNPEYAKYEVWLADRMVGMIVLSRVVGGDALFHFTLWGVRLFVARRLLLSFLTHAFTDLNLRRISVEVPENVNGLVQYLRAKLGFRYEGELYCSRHLEVGNWGKLDSMAGAPTWMSSRGSRRESAHWDGAKWRDVLLLRLMREEHLERCSLGDEPKAIGDEKEPSTDVLGSKAGEVRAGPTPGDAPGVPTAAVPATPEFTRAGG